MLSVLVNAFACSPGMGSEPGMAWNWCVNLAKYCELHIITGDEFRDRIESAVPELSHGENMHFYYNPITEKVREMCWNQGDWRFYRQYREWQKKTLLMARDIINNNHIDIIHQLNMTGFREPGYLWMIEEIPFVWGPIGGLKQFPVAYLKGAGMRMGFFNRLKNFLNVYQLKHGSRVRKALHVSNLLVSSIPDSYHAIKKYHGLESVIIPETGCAMSEDIPTDRFDDETFHVMWVGKFDFRKQLLLALKAITVANNPKIILDVYGTGSEAQVKKMKAFSDSLKIDNRVVWHGGQPNDVVMKAMAKSQLFFFTSVNEDTSTVVLEAISNRLPVVCFNTCGMATVINYNVGRKIELTCPAQSVRQFAELINTLERNRELLKQLSENCKQRQAELSWDKKAKTMVEWYKKVARQ